MVRGPSNEPVGESQKVHVTGDILYLKNPFSLQESEETLGKAP